MNQCLGGVEMFDFGNANQMQREAIVTSDGPVLITAGPGTGKTFTLVQRAIYLIQERGVQPEQIMIATFTEKAAKELVTRMTNELSKRGIVANVNEMYIGTFHSLCLRIIKEHLEYTRLKKNYRTLDAFDQTYMVFQNINKFRKIRDIDIVFSYSGSWKLSGEICSYVNNLLEELIDPLELQEDENPQIVALGKTLEVYQIILEENNFMY
jgi:DNA helicase-2/ATP-dependent DNA helicase PcrA